MQRRDLFPILGAASVLGSAQSLDAQHEHHKVPRLASGSYQLQAFSPAQDAVLDRLADILIPADATSGGAHDASVSKYLDLIVHHGPPEWKRHFEGGLAAVEKAALASFGQPFPELSRAQQTRLMETMAANEGNPINDLERFFEFFKPHVIEGYRLSHIGQTQWLKYQPHPAGLYPEEPLPPEVR